MYFWVFWWLRPRDMTYLDEPGDEKCSTSSLYVWVRLSGSPLPSSWSCLSDIREPEHKSICGRIFFLWNCLDRLRLKLATRSEDPETYRGLGHILNTRNIKDLKVSTKPSVKFILCIKIWKFRWPSVELMWTHSSRSMTIKWNFYYVSTPESFYQAISETFLCAHLSSLFK